MTRCRRCRNAGVVCVAQPMLVFWLCFTCFTCFSKRP